MPAKKKILETAMVRRINNGWLVEITGDIQHFYPSEKSWFKTDSGDEEKFFETLKEALNYLNTFVE